ncbi:sugar transferase [Paracoccus beibuensis]|uniref:sugar transferase n=1 Tax=Paracoccus beibuensis TaxID=547602 RepID=UPI002240976C|nr:sugar transferase [Paracoccus beibuensis]
MFSSESIQVDYATKIKTPAQQGKAAGTARVIGRRARPIGGPTKRAIDIVLVLTALPLLGLLMLGLAVLIKRADNGPLLYGHRRVGFKGREFKCWKFRTMVVDGDAVLERHFEKNPGDRIIWNVQRKLTNDPRITPIGAVLRKLSLDELPQLLNVLNGEMSLVGPRPVVEDELAYYGTTARYYLSARPGLTGLWQVSGRSNTTYAERVRLDRRYVSRWAHWRDLQILIKTVPALISSRGAH